MVDAPRPTLPWLLVIASVLLAVLLGYTLFSGYLPAKHRADSLERELKALYVREADLQMRLAQNEQRHALREQQLLAVTAERDALSRRLEEIQRELAVSRGLRR